jgi:hypothetical protein
MKTNIEQEIEIIAARLDSVAGLARHLSKCPEPLDGDHLVHAFCAIATAIKHEIVALDALAAAKYSRRDAA